MNNKQSEGKMEMCVSLSSTISVVLTETSLHLKMANNKQRHIDKAKVEGDGSER